ncbi:unnamed protein product [Clonostachys rosea f. rosea IK726]|uniref:Uncharacterized protein n=1 Tax=Clonostachys rosea f. rosea IK726 TaxID=1349383 RepID=A0ACA9TI01_BIOOC|nr:unnamed protein product [Clonostachys rosea f. rosea IK726]
MIKQGSDLDSTDFPGPPYHGSKSSRKLQDSHWRSNDCLVSALHVQLAYLQPSTVNTASDVSVAGGARQIKCDRRQPCARCVKAGTDCTRAGTGEKQRPISRRYVQALENQVASLEIFIKKVAIADAEQRDHMLAAFQPASTNAAPQDSLSTTSTQEVRSPEDAAEQTEASLARSSAGQMRKRISSSSACFYGGTSLFQIHLSGEYLAPTGDSISEESPSPSNPESSSHQIGPLMTRTPFPFAPHDDVCQRLMATFFKQQYQYNMCIYREYFLRDYDCGTGRYYSDLLLYAICAMGALASGEPSDRGLSEIFATQAQSLLFPSFDQPDLTVLQALVLLGQREIGHCRPSKGWLFCGIAFRLAHEMGLHLDPNNWSGSAESEVDREILRRVYWATFIADKNLSLYFGRPPALYPHESDVRNTVRLPYPTDWEGLLDTYIAPGISITAYEDGIALVGAFIYRAELSKIQHCIITDLFENRRPGAHNAAIAATVQRIHTDLTKWLSSLPGKLYWNQWTVGHVPACVLYLHMQFHTSMVILHRPPRHSFNTVDISSSEDVEICYESLQAILRLMRSYSRLYRYEELPLDFVHTLSVAASTVLMRRWLDKDMHQMEKEMNLIVQAMQAIKETWPCVEEIEKSVCKIEKCEKPADNVPEIDAMLDAGFMAGLSAPYEGENWSMPDQYTQDMFEATLGPVLTDGILGGVREDAGQLMVDIFPPALDKGE